MKKYYKQIWLTIVGILCITMTIRCFTLETLYSLPRNNYEQVTYAGTQHVSALQELTRLGLLAFFVGSFIFLGSELSDKKSDKEKDVENPFDDDVELD